MKEQLIRGEAERERLASKAWAELITLLRERVLRASGGQLTGIRPGRD